MQILNKNRRTNINELHENFISSTSINISKITLRRFLHKHNIYGRIGAKKPFVNAANKMKRLFWAKNKKDWVDEWKKIIWSDESRFVVFEGRITANIYIEMLENYLLPFINDLENKDDYTFQEDNAPIHTANKAKKWKDDNNIRSLPWPAQSPDLNPTENLCDELLRKVRKHNPLPKNKDNLWEILQEEWSKLDEDIYKNLVDSMPRRIAAVIDNKGNPTKY